MILIPKTTTIFFEYKYNNYSKLEKYNETVCTNGTLSMEPKQKNQQLF